MRPSINFFKNRLKISSHRSLTLSPGWRECHVDLSLTFSKPLFEDITAFRIGNYKCNDSTQDFIIFGLESPCERPTEPWLKKKEKEKKIVRYMTLGVGKHMKN